MILFFLPPAVRLAIGVVVVVIGLVFHIDLVALAGAAGVIFAAGQWAYRRRAGGSATHRGGRQ